MVDKSVSNQSLASTALWAAAVRARESERADALFHDPWAALLAGEAGREWIEGRSEDSVVPMVLRTRFFDDFLQKVVRDHQVEQIVMMAAGLDTRAYRFEWPAGLQFFEVDQPSVLDYAARILRSAGARPQCSLHLVGADLTRAWSQALLETGFDPWRPSVWLLEGFLFYIETAQVCHLLEDLSPLAASGSWLGFDIANSLTLTSPYTRQWIEMQARAGAPWIGSLDDPVRFLAGLGWKAALAQAGQPDLDFGRWNLPVIPVTMPNVPHHWLVTAEKG
jgi:methyltransferase (TIGR00027 family)